MNTATRRGIRFLIFITLAIIAITALYPLLYMVFSSMKPTIEFIKHPIGPPKTWYIDNFKALIYRFSMFRVFGNSILYVGLSMIACLAISIPAAYAFAKLKFAFRNGFYIIMIATMTIPGITFIIPNYLLMSKIGWTNHIISVIVIWAVTAIPSTVFLLTSLMRAMPDEVLEAIKIDGAKYFQTMTKLILPMSLPGVVTVSIFNATNWWNDLLTPLIYLQSEKLNTMTVVVATVLNRFSSDFPLLLSGLLLVSLPPIAIYIVFQGYIRKGLVVGAVK
ncbi:sugar ABC transporter permease [Paenibacillus baekrokdamisoli]|uniref:Sugar ABC transporter permease n=1 Tax=Paenibacillus baekrokdamisoli TaxID=1712516 RepID=A0A3G9J7Z8_9BACL|nr:carbohydrate ABC transporter permease [Paenibacillus baekrokdamisoli]MBB3067675.1 ABC-type glycerol-3-phosphate transport system permease component [Paenibacillus baekrokdamisoli]BBH19139.1 sugar ABC transporter permease [Paenibacillus baekrokdamisoli]